jgi:hypothetical protein
MEIILLFSLCIIYYNMQFTSERPWKPRFKVGDCIKWKNFDRLCIRSIELIGNAGLYHFDNGGIINGPSIDYGVYNYDNKINVQPAILVSRPASTGGKRKTRRNLRKRKSKRRKSNRRR